MRLATEVRRNVPVLREVGLGRLIPAHTRFAVGETPWSADKLVRTAFRVAKAKGWSTQAARIRQPAAWWAGLLEGIAESGPDSNSAHLPEDSLASPFVRQSYWEAARHEHEHEVEQSRRRERSAIHARELARQADERDERAGLNLCPHGVGGAVAGRATRCAQCRADDRPDRRGGHVT